MFHISHFLQSYMAFGVKKSFFNINAVSGEKRSPTSINMHLTSGIFPPGKPWLVNSNVRSAGWMKGWRITRNKDNLVNQSKLKLRLVLGVSPHYYVPIMSWRLSTGKRVRENVSVVDTEPNHANYSSYPSDNHPNVDIEIHAMFR